VVTKKTGVTFIARTGGTAPLVLLRPDQGSLAY